jgi:predicted esterase
MVKDKNMKNSIMRFYFPLILVSSIVFGHDENRGIFNPELRNHGIVDELENVLNRISQDSDNPFFQNHCASILTVIKAKSPLTDADSSMLENLYLTLTEDTVSWNIGALSSYLARKRPFIISWISPTDGSVSLAWLLLPENWNPEEQYPLYVRLHGLWYVYDNSIEYMTYYLGSELTFDTTFEDGYSFFPWARGNQWYQGISETDIWEGLDVLKSYVHIDPTRKYLTGFSMGGYGAWYLGQKSPDVWAAVGVYAGALWYGNNLLNDTVAQRLKNKPVYFVCGDSDGLLSNNEHAYELLQNAGNENIFFATFPGGHESRLENWQGMYEWIREFSNGEVSAVRDETRPTDFALIGNYPNPFNPETRIEYTVPVPGIVELTIFNSLGQKIRTLISSHHSAGRYEVSWDGQDDSGHSVLSGMYLCRLSVERFVLTHKMLFIK